MVKTVEQAVTFADIIFIADQLHMILHMMVDTHSTLPNKDFDYTIVKGILAEVNKYCDRSKLVVLISTVLPEL